MNELFEGLQEWARLQPQYCWGRGHCLYLKDHHGQAKIIAGIQDVNPDAVFGAVLRAIAAEDLHYHMERVDGGDHIFEIYMLEPMLEQIVDLVEGTHQEPAIAALTAWISVLRSRQSAEVEA